MKFICNYKVIYCFRLVLIGFRNGFYRFFVIKVFVVQVGDFGYFIYFYQRRVFLNLNQLNVEIFKQFFKEVKVSGYMWGLGVIQKWCICGLFQFFFLGYRVRVVEYFSSFFFYILGTLLGWVEFFLNVVIFLFWVKW